MARATIKQRISLEGGRELQDQLKALGTEGEKAFEKIRAAALKADLAKFGDSLNRVGRDFATVGRRVALAFSAITVAAGALGLSATGAALAVLGLAKAGAEQADASLKAAQAAGLQIDAYSGLAFAAKQSGADAGTFGSAMNRLNAAIADAAEAGAKSTKKLGDAAKSTGRIISEEFGRQVSVYDDAGVTVTRFGETYEKTAKKTEQATKGAAGVFARLGVSVRDSSGNLRSNEAILRDLADAFSRLPDGAEKSALAIELFGRSGTVLLPFLNLGAKGIGALVAQAQRLGITFTKEQGVVAEAMNDTLEEVRDAADGIRFQLGLLFAPAITAAAAEFRDVLIDNRQAIVEFGRSAAIWGVGVVRDLVNALTGNDAAVRRPWIVEWRDAIVTFGQDVRAVVETVVIPLFNAVRGAAGLVADAINAVFGTEITAGQVLIAAALGKVLGVFKLIGSAAGVVVAAFKLIGSALSAAFSPGVIAALAKAFGGFWGAIVRGASLFLGLVAGLVGWPALIVAAVVAAGAAIYVFWDDIVAAAQTAFTYLRDLFSVENFERLLASVWQAAQNAGALLVDAFGVALEAIGGVLTLAGTAIAGFFTGIVTRAAELAAQLLPSWEQISAVAGAVWSAFATKAEEVFGFIADKVAALGGFLQPYWDRLATAASGVWTRVSDAAGVAADFLVSRFNGAVSTITTVVGGIARATVEAFSGATSKVVDAAEAIAESIKRATEIAGDIEGAGELAAALVAPFVDASGQIEQVMAGINAIAAAGFGAVSDTVRRIGNEIRAEIARILAALRAAAAAAASLRASSSSSGGDAAGFAGGGHVVGPGTARSDSIPAWLSNGEFVMTARAVRKYGAGFMAAINNLRLPKDLLGSMRGFNMGGIVNGLNAQMAGVRVPRFADGGLALAPAAGSSGRPVTLSLDGQTFEMVAPDDVAEKLVKAITGRSLRKAGRAPTWVGA